MGSTGNLGEGIANVTPAVKHERRYQIKRLAEKNAITFKKYHKKFWEELAE